MKYTISLILIITILAGLFSACNQTPNEQPVSTTTGEIVATTQAQQSTTESTKPSGSGITASDIYYGTRASCMMNGIDDDASALRGDGEDRTFSFFMNSMLVNCETINGYVVRVISVCYDKAMLETAYGQGTSGMLTLLQVLTFPFLELDDSLDQTAFITQLLGAQKSVSDNIVHRICHIGNWQYELLIPNSDKYIAVGATYIEPQNNTNRNDPSGTADSNLSTSGSSTSGGLFERLDLSKVWKTEWTEMGFLYSALYTFEENGECYMVIDWNGTEAISGGKGTYTVDGDSVTFSLVLDGSSSVSYAYTFDSANRTFTQASEAGLVSSHKRGDLFTLTEDAFNTVDTIKNLAQTFNGTANPGNDATSGNTDSVGNAGSSGTTDSFGSSTVACSHSYTDATCTTPKTCTKCGATTGSTADHVWQYTSCTTEEACTVCGAEGLFTIPGHKWKSATCTEPETCSVCEEAQGLALGHDVKLTKCVRCDHTDYSAIAKSYPNVTAYDGQTGEGLEVTNVSVSNTGVLSFVFNDNSYSITIKERVYDSMTYFDCYQSGCKLSNAECRIGDASYYNMLHFEWDGIDGHCLYFFTAKQ